MASFQPSAQQLLDLQEMNRQRSMGNTAWGGNVGASNTGNTSFNLSKGQTWSSPAATTPESQNNQPEFSVPSGPSQQEVDSIYNPLFSSLGEQENQIRSDAEKQQQLLRTSQTDQLSSLSRNKALTEQDIATQNTETDKQVKSALGDAIRAYNSLEQQRRSRFGGQSSAGQATSEIVQGEFFRGQAKVQEQGQKQFGEIRKYANQAMNFFLDEESRINREYQEKAVSIIQQMNNNILSTKTQRNTLESQKAARILDYKREAEQYIAELKNKHLSEQLALERWKEQTDYQLKANIEQISSQRYTVPAGSVSSPEFSSFNGQQQPLTYAQPNKARYRNTEDDFDFLMDDVA
jgi:hypothetical protein